MAQFLSEGAKIIHVEPAAAAGQTTLTTDKVDMSGFDRLLIAVVLGASVTAAATLTLTLKTGDAEGDAGTATACVLTYETGASDANRILLLDIARPNRRWVHATLARASQDVAVDAILFCLYDEKAAPITQDDDVAKVTRFALCEDAS